ncbi:MAG: hypothetical protein ACXQS8_06540 [Candidatus Helarchaeales archaeon]
MNEAKIEMRGCLFSAESGVDSIETALADFIDFVDSNSELATIPEICEALFRIRRLGTSLNFFRVELKKCIKLVETLD